MEFFAFTNNHLYIKALDQCENLDTIFIDLEILGKEKRQAGTNSLISKHTLEDIKICSSILNNSFMGVRINPLNKNSKIEIEECIANGAEVLMLPMFYSVEEVNDILRIINSRCQLDLLFETPKALENIKKFPFQSIRYSHFGLNDLSIALKKKHIFDMFFTNILNDSTEYLRTINHKFGIGGVGAIGSKPFSPKLIFTMHKILSSKRCILSRSFLSKITNTDQCSANKSCIKNTKDLIKLWYDLQNLSSLEIDKYKSNFNDLLKRNF